MQLNPISKSRLAQILFVLICFTLLSYFYRNPTGDDAWFAEQSYWFTKERVFRSEFFRGMGLLGWEKQLFVSHKLFLLFGAGMIQVFGYHLPVVQFVGIISFCFVVSQLIYYLYKREGNLNSWLLLAILILVFSNRVFIKMSFENRPELMVAALGFGSFLTIYFMKSNNQKAALAGILAGCALLCHLNGVIYLVAGAGTLIYLKY